MAIITLPNNWKPRKYQLDAWRYLENGGKHAELIWHRRSGKDEICLHRAACAAFERSFSTNSMPKRFKNNPIVIIGRLKTLS